MVTSPAVMLSVTRSNEESSEAGDVAQIRRLAEAYATAQAQLDGLMADWTALAAEYT